MTREEQLAEARAAVARHENDWGCPHCLRSAREWLARLEADLDPTERHVPW